MSRVTQESKHLLTFEHKGRNESIVSWAQIHVIDGNFYFDSCYDAPITPIQARRIAKWLNDRADEIEKSKPQGAKL